MGCDGAFAAVTSSVGQDLPQSSYGKGPAVTLAATAAALDADLASVLIESAGLTAAKAS